MTRARLLVLGSSGQLGRQIMQVALADSSIDTIGLARTNPGRSAFDLAEPSATEALIESVRPSHTILAAAATNVAWCETHVDESWAVNVTGTGAVARACERVESALTFLSTDYVFDGSSAPSGEEDPTNPLNAYGRQKLAAEEIIAATSDRTLVVRTCQVFGRDPRRANFVLRVVDQLRDGEILQAPTNLYGTPTYAEDLARDVLALTLEGAEGIWHVAGDSFVSRFDLATAAARAFGLKAARIEGTMADEVSDGVMRPLRSGLRCDRLIAAKRYAPTPLEAALTQLASAESAA
jgi:dTDP-4-dehydrorhamnose reductase